MLLTAAWRGLRKPLDLTEPWFPHLWNDMRLEEITCNSLATQQSQILKECVCVFKLVLLEDIWLPPLFQNTGNTLNYHKSRVPIFPQRYIFIINSKIPPIHTCHWHQLQVKWWTRKHVPIVMHLLFQNPRSSTTRMLSIPQYLRCSHLHFLTSVISFNSVTMLSSRHSNWLMKV